MMASKATIFVGSLILLIALSEQIDYDYLQMVYEWQPAMCNGDKYCKESVSNHFSIHGLWPSTYEHGQIGPCSGTDYNPDLIKALKPRMHQNWPDVVNGKPEEEWAKKWSIHGTCSEHYMNQKQYFSLAMDKYAQYGVQSYLENEKIYPNFRKYRIEEIQGAIALYTGKKPAVRCNLDGYGRKQLEKVTMCFTKEGKYMIDCPNLVDYTCPEEFYWNGMRVY